jgi:hypothetical protein
VISKRHIQIKEPLCENVEALLKHQFVFQVGNRVSTLLLEGMSSRLCTTLSIGVGLRLQIELYRIAKGE